MKFDEAKKRKISQEEAQTKIAKIGQAQRRAGLEIEEKKETLGNSSPIFKIVS